MKTRTFKLDKLVRDGIVDSTESQGGVVNFRKLSGREYTDALVKKLVEETQELQMSDLSVGELADLKEIIEQIAANLKITKQKLEAEQAKKNKKIGGFKKGHYIDTLTLPADNHWSDYYASDPERFPEITEDKQ